MSALQCFSSGFVIWLKCLFSPSASVIVILRSNNSEGVVFVQSYYNFSLFENEPAGTALGQVKASSESDLYDITYSLRNYDDLFSVDVNGTLQTREPLDTERQELYFLKIEAKDSRTPPTSAVAIVRPVLVSDRDVSMRLRVLSFGLNPQVIIVTSLSF